MRTTDSYQGEEASQLYGVCDCERATLLNQIWNLVEPDSRPPCYDGTYSHIRYIICGLCGRARSEGATAGVMAR